MKKVRYRYQLVRNVDDVVIDEFSAIDDDAALDHAEKFLQRYGRDGDGAFHYVISRVLARIAVRWPEPVVSFNILEI